MTGIAQVGCGHWGKNLARNFSEAGVLRAIVDGNPITSAEISKRLSVPILTFEEVLSSDNIQGIALATPAETHAELGIRALKAGKHLFVEKPIALSVPDAEALINTAKECGRILMVGHLLQYHSVFQKLLAEVKAGKIGDLQYVYSNRMSLGKFRTEEDVMWSFAPHDASMLVALAGEPEEVHYSGASFVSDGLDDWSILNMKFPNNVSGHIQTSWCHPFKEQRLVVIGTNGMLVFEDSNPEWSEKLAFYKHTIDKRAAVPVPSKADVEYLNVVKTEPLRAECDEFIACIQEGRQALTDGAEGIAVLRVLTQAEASKG